MKTVPLPGAEFYYTQMKMYTYTLNKAIKFQGNYKNTYLTHHVKTVLWIREGIENGPSKKKWTEHEYHVQDIIDVTHSTAKDVMCHNTVS